MTRRCVVHLNLVRQSRIIDIDVPLDINAKEFLEGISQAYSLDIDTEDASQCYVKSENPTRLMHGRKTLGEYGIMDGSIINITE